MRYTAVFFAPLVCFRIFVKVCYAYFFCQSLTQLVIGLYLLRFYIYIIA